MLCMWSMFGGGWVYVACSDFLNPWQTCHVSCVTCHLPCITCHLSSVTCHMSPVTCHLTPDTSLKPAFFEKCKNHWKSSKICFIFFQPNISYMHFNQRSLDHQEVPFPAVDRQTHTQTHTQASRLIDWIGWVGRFSENCGSWFAGYAQWLR